MYEPLRLSSNELAKQRLWKYQEQYFVFVNRREIPKTSVIRDSEDQHSFFGTEIRTVSCMNLLVYRCFKILFYFNFSDIFERIVLEPFLKARCTSHPEKYVYYMMLYESIFV